MYMRWWREAREEVELPEVEGCSAGVWLWRRAGGEDSGGEEAKRDGEEGGGGKGRERDRTGVLENAGRGGHGMEGEKGEGGSVALHFRTGQLRLSCACAWGDRLALAGEGGCLVYCVRWVGREGERGVCVELLRSLALSLLPRCITMDGPLLALASSREVLVLRLWRGEEDTNCVSGVESEEETIQCARDAGVALSAEGLTVRTTD